MIKVFVSSVSEGLAQVRQQVIRDLHKAGYDVTAMEHFGAQADTPIEVCLREVRRADVVVLAVGPRYGSLLPQGISYTEAEFREARAAGIPVLAVRVPNEPDLDLDEEGQIDAFLNDVGSVSTYDTLTQDDSLDRLSPTILAALSSARDRGELGNRFSLFQRYELYFVSQLDPSAIFNHEGPFLGRADQTRQLVSFIKSEEPLLLLTGAGGSGKSRLLLEATREVADSSGAPEILFVDAGAQWSADDITRLPITPLVLIIDDAHRRPDLDRLIAACQQHNRLEAIPEPA